MAADIHFSMPDVRPDRSARSIRSDAAFDKRLSYGFPCFPKRKFR